MLATALRWMLAASIAMFVVLLVTGLYLTWNYRPTDGLAWADMEDGVKLTAGAHIAHQVAGRIFVALGLAVGVVATVLAVRRRRVGAGLAAVTFLVAALAASFSGSLLPWDQLGLWAVTVGTELKGYAPIISGDEIRFVIVGRSQISTGTLTRWFFAHEIVLPAVLIGLGIALFRASSTRPVEVEPERQ